MQSIDQCSPHFWPADPAGLLFSIYFFSLERLFPSQALERESSSTPVQALSRDKPRSPLIKRSKRAGNSRSKREAERSKRASSRQLSLSSNGSSCSSCFSFFAASTRKQRRGTSASALLDTGRASPLDIEGRHHRFVRFGLTRLTRLTRGTRAGTKLVEERKACVIFASLVQSSSTLPPRSSKSEAFETLTKKRLHLFSQHSQQKQTTATTTRPASSAHPCSPRAAGLRPRAEKAEALAATAAQRKEEEQQQLPLPPLLLALLPRSPLRARP